VEADEVVWRALVARERALHYGGALESLMDVLASLDESEAVETAATVMLWWSAHGIAMSDFLTEPERIIRVSLLTALMPDAALLMGEVAGHA